MVDMDLIVLEQAILLVCECIWLQSDLESMRRFDWLEPI